MPAGAAAPRVVNLADHRPAVTYELFIVHHWDQHIEVWARGIALDHKANPALAAALRQYADSIG